MDFSEAIRMSERNLTDRTTPVELRQLACDLGALTPTAFLPILSRLGSRSLRDAGTVSEATADPSQVSSSTCAPFRGCSENPFTSRCAADCA
jgi:hypothetical protein